VLPGQGIGQLPGIDQKGASRPFFPGDAPDPGARAGHVAELRSITEEIDDLTKAVLDTITLETALKSTRLRREAAAGTS